MTPKDSGLANLPSADFAINQAWFTVVLLAVDLLAAMRCLCLKRRVGPGRTQRLRYCLLHAAGIIVRSARRTTLRLQKDGLEPTSWSPRSGVSPTGPSPEGGFYQSSVELVDILRPQRDDATSHADAARSKLYD